LTINSAVVDGKTVIVNRARNLSLGPFPADTTFYFGSITNPLTPGLRIRYKLDGYENVWHDGPCQMYFAVRFFNSQGDQIIQNTFTVSGESAGWNGSLTTSPLTHRRELVDPKTASTVGAPPHLARV